MKTSLLCLALLGISAGFLLIGCDTPPAPPQTALGKPAAQLAVSGGDPEELADATALEKARSNYLYRLQVLRGYYDKVGNLDKMTWTDREIKALQQAKTFRWENVPDVIPPQGESLEGADEQLLAEYVNASRKDYVKAVDKLLRYYEKTSQTYKAETIRNMNARFDPVRQYRYFLPAEIPPANLRASAVIPEADVLYDKAYRMYKSGKILPAVTDYAKERQALDMFIDLVEKYPTSTKIALAAYFIADIYKEYFNEDVRAVQWYERAWQWDPNITKPARFQAATVWDLRLHNKARAVECYRGAILHEPFNSSNVRYSYQRIKELSGEEYMPGK